MRDDARDLPRDNDQSTNTAGVESTSLVVFDSGPEPSDSPELPRALKAGTTIGRYELREVLGSGGMGVVYRAHDPHLSRDVALKLLHPRRTDVPEGNPLQARLLQEARALARLSHPNVVAAYDVGTYGDAVFVAMELVVGVSLRRWLEDKPRLQDVLRVLIAAGRGLEAAHAADVLHRDFKPSNVMVSPDGRIRVVDFGLARAAHAELDARQVRVVGAIHHAHPTDGAFECVDGLSAVEHSPQLATERGVDEVVALNASASAGRDRDISTWPKPDIPILLLH